MTALDERKMMTDDNFDEELERRLRLLEDPASGEGPLENLPWQDVAAAVIGLAVISVLLLVWGYPR
ncbi:hypothetical protein [Aeromicrobium sp.]|uniref:hypothetical protein n=1 Tax=Aeromicrobium sp. TaxID=1871063 RepID=UPI0028A86DC7|nr:hypothetical protein [Aeromicrobium sp.]